MSSNKALVALDVGHSERDRGAQSPFPPFTNEWEYNTGIAELVSSYVYETEAITIFRDPVKDGYQRLPAKINAVRPDLILSLHCNAATPAAFGTEMIYHPGSVKGENFAGILQQEVCTVFGRTDNKTGDRGIKTPINGLGSSLLAKTIAPCVIAEPFFLSNEEDHQKGLDLKHELAQAYARAIDAFARSFL